MDNKVTLQEIKDSIVEKTGDSKIFVDTFIHELLNIIKEGLQRDGQVNLSGLGKFKLKWVEIQNARNPITGETIEVPAHNKIIFKPEKKMRIFVNRKFNHLTSKEITVKKVNTPKINEETIMKESIIYGQNDVPPNPNEKNDDLSEDKKKKYIIPIIGIIILLLILLLLFLFLNKKKDKNDSPIAPKLTIVDSTQTTVDSTETDKDKDTEIEKEEKEEADVSDDMVYNETSIIHKVKAGNTLWSLANKYYNNAPLWPNIYRKNLENVIEPDIIFPGMVIEIPNLEGTGHALTKQDSFNIAEGYYLSYLAYKKFNLKDAKNYLRIAKRFNTTVEENKK
ncbi:MAG: HU family DNA-binding protein [Candidatus Marinimicrobia bacterium]|nr:HU family DNA-binding protein [Candidatus Neomarinimicrobiota bacterium]